jgi:acetyl esterase/lipase
VRSRPWNRRRTAPSLGDELAIELHVGQHGEPEVGDLFRPRGPPRAGLVLLHGSCGRREDLTQFAVALARGGACVLNASWRGPGIGVSLAAGRARVEGALRFASRRFDRPVALVAWSDGTMIGAAAALDRSDDTLTSFVGLAGYYGWAGAHVPDGTVNRRTIEAVGGTPGEVPDRWSSVNPYTYLASRSPGLPIVLVTGDRDPQRAHSSRFHRALQAAGHRSSLFVVDACDHTDIVVPRHPPGREVVSLVLQAATPCDPR